MIPKPLRELVRQRAQGRCEYCQTSEWLNGLSGKVDHIFPRAQGGPTDADNLCFACSSCNGYKQARFRGVDPETGLEVPLFHPRRQVWRDHFTWSQDGTLVIGLTPCGRATIEALRLNHPLIVVARAIWARVGLHPPV
jgi:hypothetical protein